jgi:hypothetical protein
MNENRVQVDLVAFESVMARNERQLKRMWAALIVMALVAVAAIGALILQHKYYLDYLSQYDFESTSYEYEYSQDGRGLNIIGDNNEVTSHEPEGENQEDHPEEDP